jgi:hypothetical protein
MTSPLSKDETRRKLLGIISYILTLTHHFHRYIDDIFLTWNRSEQELENLLNEANHWHSNIKLD